MDIDIELKKFKQDLQNLVDSATNHGDVNGLYHYTTIEGLYGIIKEKKIWLSELEATNDKSEKTLFFEALKKHILSEEMFNKYQFLSNDENHLAKVLKVQFDDNFREQLIKIGKKLPQYPHKKYGIYNFSLCENIDDNPHMWSTYSNKGMGYAIKFNKDKLRSICNASVDCTNKIRLAKVIYDEKETIKFANKTCDVVNEKYQQLGSNNISQEVSKLFHNDMWMYILNMCPIFKNETFSSEHEIRLLHIRDPLQKDIEQGIERIGYRQKHGILVPYYMLPFEVDVIEEIWIGPSLNQSLAEKYIEKLLSDNFKNVKIMLSKIPYQP